tara:strand:+ start:390 stop:899 length:510 start_codon:yes stop_codon:yes gene_type:complete
MAVKKNGPNFSSDDANVRCRKKYKRGTVAFAECKNKLKEAKNKYKDKKKAKTRKYKLDKAAEKSKKSLVKVNIDKSKTNSDNVNVKGTSSSKSDATATAKAKAKAKSKSKAKIHSGIRTSFPLHTSPDPNKKRSPYSEGATITRPKSLPKKKKGSDWHQVADGLKGKLY